MTDMRAPPPTIVDVALGARAYAIVIGPGLLAGAGARIAALEPGARVAVVTDETVAALHLPALAASLDAAGVRHDVVTVRPGESSKAFSTLADVCERLIATRIERGDLVLAFGGGVVGDLAGFAAAIVRRGMRFVQVPTTLLAQVDSSVGGKTGINSAHGKNLVGAFHQPMLVLADTGILDTLLAPRVPRRLRRGRQIRPDRRRPLLPLARGQLARRPAGGPAREHAIAVACRAKAAIVARDETETGDRALLNLGHTFGHALEAVTGYDAARLVHGEGVAIGMVLALRVLRPPRPLRAGGTVPHRGPSVRGRAADTARRHSRAGPGPPTPCSPRSPRTRRSSAAPSPSSWRGPSAAPSSPATSTLRPCAPSSATSSPRCSDRRDRERVLWDAGPVPAQYRAMTIEIWISALAVFFLLALAFFFAGSETALTAASRARMLALERGGSLRAKTVNRLLDSREAMIGSVLVGTSVVNTAAAALTTGVLFELFGDVGIVYATVAISIVSIIFAEILPKTLAINYPERFSLAVAVPVRAMVLVLAPLTNALTGLSRFVLRLAGFKVGERSALLSATDELRGTVDLMHKEGSVEKTDRDMLGGLLDLRELTVGDVMVHRTKMFSVDLGLGAGPLVQSVLAAPYTRVPLWRDEPDNIVGVVHAKDLLRALDAVGNDTTRLDVEQIAQGRLVRAGHRPR